MLRPDCIEQTAHVFCVLQWARHYKVDVEVLMISAFMGKAPAWYPQVLTLSRFAVDNAVNVVPIAA